jgi:uncharacterized membrane protein YhaH (DUF805 family)
VTLIGYIVAFMLLAVVVLTIMDIVKRHLPAGATAGWIVLVILLPFVGAVIYWVVRKPDQVDPEQVYRLEAEQRRAAAHRPMD